MDEKLFASWADDKYSESNRPSKTAEVIAMIRAKESRRLEDERICYDPYAIRFVSKATLEFVARHPETYKAMAEKVECKLPGHTNSILARVRYFDDVVISSIREGIEQIVFLGAGYDTRAYRIEGVDKIRVFEVDHPNTQPLKKEKIRDIFGVLPAHVTYVPVDLQTDDLGRRLFGSGYNSSRRTLFVMEGLLMYLPPRAVDELLAFAVHNSGKGSAVLFDYISQSVVDGTNETELGKNMAKSVSDVGEPFQFGLPEGTLRQFLAARGFSKIRDVTSEDYRKMYFQGKNEARLLNPLIIFAYAEVW